jgi:hypothetical protein
MDKYVEVGPWIFKQTENSGPDGQICRGGTLDFPIQTDNRGTDGKYVAIGPWIF